ncbi:MAG: NUDIX domain-containing protein [Clostridia bacterium]|nr:NUDIX domain-containing protein [Clostridia bacterium]
MKTINTKESSRRYRFRGSMGEIELSFDLDNLPGTADSVIVFIPWGNGLITVHNPIRGWEIPGGRLESGESEKDAVLREAYEEAGCRVGEPAKFGQYRFKKGKQSWVMTIALYYAEGLKLEPIPEGSEMVDIEILSLGCLERVVTEHKYNPAMRDKVFTLAIQRLRELGLLPVSER